MRTKGSHIRGLQFSVHVGINSGLPLSAGHCSSHFSADANVRKNAKDPGAKISIGREG
jgi:hypothetical protein